MSGFHESHSWLQPPNGPRFCCGRLARWRVGRPFVARAPTAASAGYAALSGPAHPAGALGPFVEKSASGPKIRFTSRFRRQVKKSRVWVSDKGTIRVARFIAEYAGSEATAVPV